AFFGDNGCKNLFALGAMGAVLWQEHHSDAVFAWWWQSDAGLLCDQFQEGVRGLNEDAGPIAGIGLATAGAAMVQIRENLQSLLDDRVRLRPFDVDNKTDAARFVLELRVIEAL